MRNFWRLLELEWKILALAGLVFVAVAWPVQQFFILRLRTTLAQSIDPGLERVLRDRLGSVHGAELEALTASLERARQWQALLPMIVEEQRRAVLFFSLGMLLVFGFIALWTLRRLTRPLKDLARAVQSIGRGEPVPVACRSGGALGTLEQAVTGLQEELTVLRERARVQGMEKAWQDIARVMAHEIKNPLTPIRLTLDRIEERVAAGEEVGPLTMGKYLSRINAQVDLLERLVNQFGSFSREPDVRLARIVLGDIIAKVADSLASRLTTDIRGDAAVDADPHLLEQVLLNLWKNALEAGATAVAADVVRGDDQVLLSISDNGPGIDEGALERVWLPYVSFKDGGTGLGLPVVKKLTETMGATVSLRSETAGGRHGTTVTLAFPALHPQPGGSHAAAGANPDCR